MNKIFENLKRRYLKIYKHKEELRTITENCKNYLNL